MPRAKIPEWADKEESGFERRTRNLVQWGFIVFVFVFAVIPLIRTFVEGWLV